MSVYTEVSRDVLATFLDNYSLGDVLAFQGILEGIENSNFFLETSVGRYVLTIFEKRAAKQDLPYFLGLMEYLADKNFPAPKPIKNFNGATLGKILGKPATIVTFLDGKCKNSPSLDDVKAAGTALANLHITATDFPMQRSNNLGLDGWRPLFQKSVSRAHEIHTDLVFEIESALDRLEKSWPHDLPKGTIHADLFPDNMFLKDGTVSGVIDYYFAATDAYAYDLAITLNAWCINSECVWDNEAAMAMIGGYEAIRPLNLEEKKALPLLLEGAALRFLLTRLHDWLNPEPDALVKPKDPLQQLACLKLHQTGQTIR